MLEEANQRGRILRPPLSEQHDKTPHPAYLPVLQHDSQYHETFGFKPQLYDGYRWANHRPVLLPQSNKKTQMVFVLQPNDGAQDWIEGDGEWSASAGSKWLYLADAVSVFTIWCVLFW